MESVGSYPSSLRAFETSKQLCSHRNRRPAGFTLPVPSNRERISSTGRQVILGLVPRMSDTILAYSSNVTLLCHETL